MRLPATFRFFLHQWNWVRGASSTGARHRVPRIPEKETRYVPNLESTVDCRNCVGKPVCFSAGGFSHGGGAARRNSRRVLRSSVGLVWPRLVWSWLVCLGAWLLLLRP